MFLGKKEHNPPHFHAYYQDYKGTFDIRTGEMIEGNLYKLRLIACFPPIG